MRGGFGPRFVVEALFLVAVAAVAGLAEFPTEAIVLVMGLAWLLVAGVEWALSRSGAFPLQGLLRRRASAEPPTTVAAPDEVPVQHVRVMPREPEPAAQPVIARRPEPMPEPELDAPPAPEPTPPVIEPALSEPTPAPERPAEEPPAPEPEPEPEPERAPLVAVEPPAPEPEPERVVALPLSGTPREWNVWELERLVREHSGEDAAVDEERSYLLVYLREFATPEGTLPVDFDALVRESFGPLLAAAR